MPLWGVGGQTATVSFTPHLSKKLDEHTKSAASSLLYILRLGPTPSPGKLHSISSSRRVRQTPLTRRRQGDVEKWILTCYFDFQCQRAHTDSTLYLACLAFVVLPVLRTWMYHFFNRPDWIGWIGLDWTTGRLDQEPREHRVLTPLCPAHTSRALRALHSPLVVR